MVEATGKAGDLSGSKPIGSAVGVGEAGQIRAQVTSAVMGNVEIKAAAEVFWAPFNEGGIAEKLAGNPEFYRRLASYVASELQREIATLDASSHSNSVEAVRSELVRQQEGFEKVALELTSREGVLTPGAAERVARIIVGLRDTFAGWYQSHPEFIELAIVGAVGYALHQFGGVTADSALFVSYAVVRREKLSDILHGSNKDKDK